MRIGGAVRQLRDMRVRDNGRAPLGFSKEPPGLQ